MKPKEVKELLKSVISKKVKVPIILRGEAGIGKSWIVKEACADLGFKCIDLRLAQMEPGDLIGLPRTDSESKRTIWLAPEWWPSQGKVVIFFDELNRAPVDVRQAIFQVLTEYKMHTHTLPEDVYLVSAINPDDGKTSYQVEQFDPAMVNRMCFIDVEPDIDQWMEWAHANKLHEMVTRFLSVHSNLLHSSTDTGPFPSPRSWHKLSDLLLAEAIPTTAQSEVISGLVGNKPAVAFIRFMDKSYKKPVSGKEVLESFDKVKEKVKKQENAETYATVTDLVGLIGDGTKITKVNLDNIIDFALTIKQEEKMAFLKKVPNGLLAKLGNRSTDLCNAIAAITEEMTKDRK